MPKINRQGTVPLLQQAVNAHQRMAFVEAERDYLKVLELQPRNPDALHLLGILRQQTGSTSEAESLIRKAIDEQASPVFLSNLGNLLRISGRTEEAEQMYRRALSLDVKLADAHHGLGIILKGARRFTEAESAYRSAIVLEPKNSDALINLGILLKETDRAEEAKAVYVGLIQSNPNNTLAYFNLAVLLGEQGRAPEAEAAYLKVLQIRPGFAQAHLNLGSLFGKSGRLKQAEDSYRRALALEPQQAEAHINLGNLYTYTGRLDEAEAAYRDALKFNPNSTEARAYLSFLLLSLGRFSEGWPLHEVRNEGWLVIAGYAKKPPPFKKWDGEPLLGKSLLVLMEQGYGDAIQFARYAPMLKAKGVTRLTLICKQELHSLFKTLRGVDEVYAAFANLTPHDFWCFSMSLPFHYGTTLTTIPSDIPYLHAIGERLERFPELALSRRPKVGLAWKGNPDHSNDKNRSLSGFAALSPLWSIKGIDFVSLQKGPAANEVLESEGAQPTLKLAVSTTDFADTAAIIAQLDLVICVDTSVAHLAGAMGKPTWVLLPAIGTDWRWLRDREDSPWYPGLMRLFRQSTPNDWESTISDVAKALSLWSVPDS